MKLPRFKPPGRTHWSSEVATLAVGIAVAGIGVRMLQRFLAWDDITFDATVHGGKPGVALLGGLLLLSTGLWVTARAVAALIERARR